MKTASFGMPLKTNVKLALQMLYVMELMLPNVLNKILELLMIKNHASLSAQKQIKVEHLFGIILTKYVCALLEKALSVKHLVRMLHVQHVQTILNQPLILKIVNAKLVTSLHGQVQIMNAI